MYFAKGKKMMRRKKTKKKKTIKYILKTMNKKTVLKNRRKK